MPQFDENAVSNGRQFVRLPVTGRDAVQERLFLGRPLKSDTMDKRRDAHLRKS